MSIELTALVLFAAALHAGWNTLIKINRDRIAVMTFVLKEGFGVWRFVSASFVTFGLILSRRQK